MNLNHYAVHVAAGFIIVIAVVVNLIDITDTQVEKEHYWHYALLLILCSVFDVMSHALKESIVR